MERRDVRLQSLSVTSSLVLATVVLMLSFQPKTVQASRTTAFEREPELLGQTVVVIGGSAGIGPEVACEPEPRAPTSS